jgi:hypothetical protein
VALLLVRVGTFGRFELPDELARAGASGLDLAIADPTPRAVDEVLDRRGDRRLLIDADLVGLNLVLTRLMRRDELATADTAVLPRGPVGYLTRMGLPKDRNRQVDLALHGRPRLVGVIKDDSGGLCVDGASMAPWDGAEAWWLRAVVDDDRLSDGNARSLRLRRLGPAELEATVRLGRFRSRTQRGRSLQLACDDSQIVSDGIPRERPRSKRTFWSEPKLWRLALPERATQ